MPFSHRAKSFAVTELSRPCLVEVDLIEGISK